MVRVFYFFYLTHMFQLYLAGPPDKISYHLENLAHTAALPLTRILYRIASIVLKLKEAGLVDNSRQERRLPGRPTQGIVLIIITRTSY